MKESFSWAIVSWLLVTALVCGCSGQTAQSNSLNNNAAETLYLRLRSVGLDKSRVYKARDISFDRGAFHITLDDGTIAFTEDVMGRVTGAFFEGDGEVLLVPPDQVERSSMALFTGAAILEERFVTAYFRFNDDTFTRVQPTLIPAEDPQEFVSQRNETARNLAQTDALRLLLSFSRLLPTSNVVEPIPCARTCSMRSGFSGSGIGSTTLDVGSNLLKLKSSRRASVWARLRAVSFLWLTNS